jgi:malate permease and related proteins
MNLIVEVLIKTFPVIGLILLGVLLRRISLITQDTVDGLKKIVVNIALPSALFLTFARTGFRPEYLLIAAVMFGVCLLMLGAGVGIGRKLQPGNPYYPALFAGFEAGMMGYSLFASLFGSENTYKFAVIDVGQVLFVFFVLTAFLKSRRGEKIPVASLMMDFFRSPVILAILLGNLLGSTGLFARFESLPASEAVTALLGLLGDLTRPLICLVIGYELRFSLSRARKTFLSVLIRMGILLFLAFAVNELLIKGVLHLDRTFQAAVYLMFLLPPPFVIPIYMDKSTQEKKSILLDTISLHVLMSLAAAVVLVFAFR